MCTWPAYGGGFDGIPDLQEIQFGLPGSSRGNQYNVRLDFTPTEKDSLTLSTILPDKIISVSTRARAVADGRSPLQP